MPQHPKDTDGTRTRQTAAMTVAFMLIGTPIVGLLLFGILRGVSPGSTAEWLFVIALVWFVFASEPLEKAVKALHAPMRFRRFDTPNVRKGVVETLTFSPFIAFCLISETATGSTAVLQWFGGLALSLVAFPIWLFVLNRIGALWKAWRASRA